MSTLHLAFPAALSQRLRDAAEARGLTPQVLVAGALACLLDGELFDAVFDGLDPHEASAGAGGHGKRPGSAGGLTHLQCAVLVMIGQRAGDDRVCHLSADSYAHLVGGAPPSSVRDALGRLVGRGLIVRTEKRFAGGVQPHRLTATGAHLAQELSGDVPRGWEGRL